MWLGIRECAARIGMTACLSLSKVNRVSLSVRNAGCESANHGALPTLPPHQFLTAHLANIGMSATDQGINIVAESRFIEFLAPPQPKVLIKSFDNPKFGLSKRLNNLHLSSDVRPN